MNKEITIFWFGEDRQAYAFLPAFGAQAGLAYVEYNPDVM